MLCHGEGISSKKKSYMWFCCRLIESSCVLFSRRLRRSRREECSKLHYFAEKDRLLLSLFCGYCIFVVCLRHLRDLRETLGFRLCGLIEYSCVLFSRRLRRSRRGMQQSCIISQRKDTCNLGEM